MSMVDYEERFAENVAVTTTAILPNYIDLNAQRDIATGHEVKAEFAIPVDFAGGTSANFQVVTSDDPAFASYEIVGQTGAIPVANLTSKGQTYEVVLSPNSVSLTGRRYLGARVEVVGTMTAGKVTAYLSPGGNNFARQAAYPTAPVGY